MNLQVSSTQQFSKFNNIHEVNKNLLAILDPEYGHFVLERVHQALNESLFELNALIAICHIEKKLTQVHYYRKLCQVEIGSKNCCRPWSIPNYVALLSNRSSCFDIEVSIVPNCYHTIAYTFLSFMFSHKLVINLYKYVWTNYRKRI